MTTVNFGLQGAGKFHQVKNNGKRSAFSGLKKGMIVDGLITHVSDKVSIRIQDVEVQAASSAIRDATEGETRKFEIMDVSKDGIAIKEVGQQIQSSGNSAKTTATVAVVKQAAQVIASAVDSEKERERKQKKEEITHSANDITGRMTGSDYGSIANEGVSVEDMELNAFDAALERAKEVHNIERSMTSVNHASNFVPKEFQSDARQSKIAAKLMMANLPATAANVSQVTQELDNLDICNQLSDRTISYLIEMDMEPTAENLYRGSYAGMLSFQEVSESVWSALEGQAKDTIAQAGLEENAQNIKNAKWLIANDLPLTPETIRKTADLQAARGTLNEDDCTDRMIDVMAKGFLAKTAVLVGGEVPDPYVNKDLSVMTQQNNVSVVNTGASMAGMPLTSAKTPDASSLADNMTQLLLSQAGRAELAANNAGVVQQIPSITDDAVSKAALENREMTLGNLLGAQDEINGGDVSWKSIPVTPQTALAEIRAKRQLEEIRLKMTTEAGNRLAAKGIRLDTTGLQRVVAELRNLEQEYFQSFQNGTATAESLAQKMEIFQKTTEAVFALQSAPSFVLGMSVDHSEDATLTSLVNDTSAVDMRQVRASGVYESLSTEVRKDLGDSIKKAFQNVDHILEDMNLETTEANQRAVRILGYNHLDITEENINRMKQYDGEVNYTLSKMHPAVAISMIKEGINPLSTPIAELNDQIDRIRQQEGITSEKKYTSYLWKLEKSENFTKQEKNAFIGIFRLINAIKNSDGAAVGSVVNAGQELTLHNLLQAVRTLQNGGVDEKVDTETGMLEQVGYKNSIEQQILRGYEGKEQPAEQAEDMTADYADTLAGNILDSMTPQKLHSIWQQMDGDSTEGKLNSMLSQSLEKFAQEVENAEQTPEGAKAEGEYHEVAAEHIRSILENSSEEVEYLLEHELPISTNMIDAVRQMSQGGRKFFEALQQKAKEAGGQTEELLAQKEEQLVEGFTSPENAKSAYQEFMKAADLAAVSGYERADLTAEGTWELQSFRNGVALMASLAQRREQYRVPVWTEDGSVTDVNLTLIRGADQKGKVHVDIASAHLGEIHADYKLVQGRVSGFIVCSNRLGQDSLKKQEGSFREKLAKIGLAMGSIHYALQRGNTSYKSILEASQPDSGVNTQLLYQTAKCVIETVKEMEKENLYEN